MAATTHFDLQASQPIRTSRLVICHFTVAHTALKSRTFHRQLLPLSQAGFEIRYLAPVPRSERRGGIELIAIPKRNGFVARLKSLPVLFWRLLRQKAHVFHFQDPQLLPLAFALKVFAHRRVVYDAFEDFPSIAAAKRSIPAPFRAIVARLVALAENAAARIFDGIITADPITMRRFARVGKSRKLVVYNFPNLDFFPAPHSVPKKFDLVYRGGLSKRTGTFVLLEALRLLSIERRVPRLLLIGYFDDSRTEKFLRQRIHELGLEDSLEIRGRIDHEEMAAALSEARIGVSPLLAVPKFQKNIPVKIFEFWACGLPVVASDLIPMRPFFRHGEAGLLVQPGSAVELAAAIAWLLDEPVAARRMGVRGCELIAQRFTHAREVQKLRRMFQAIADRGMKGGPHPCSNLS